MALKDFLDDTEVAVPPPPLPVGTYTFVVQKHTFGESRQKKTPQVEFELRPVAVKEDVDQELLAAMATPWDKDPVKHPFYFTDKSLFMVDEFCEKCGVNMKLPRSERIVACIGKTIDGHISHGQSNNGRTFAQIDTFAPAE